MPVLEALRDRRVVVDKVLVSRTSRGPSVDEILQAAAQRGLVVQRVSADRVTRLSRNGRHDQGVVADLEAPGLAELDDWLAQPPQADRRHLLVLDGVTNPANVGMVIRSAAATGMAAVVLPRTGSPDLGALVIKASAGVALTAPVLRAATSLAAVDALSAAGWGVHGMRASGAASLWDTPVGRDVAFVLGNETAGVSPRVAERISSWLSIPLAAGVESLNVAAAAAVLGYELARRATATAS
jgi:23S rRNA (guanosine2251-2'-O)-methyltransferase